MKGFKAFEKGLICDPTGKNPFQYAENTVFEQIDEPTICKSGFHFCKNPLDILDYYPLIDDDGNLTEFAEVEALAETKTNDNKKYCTKKLKIGAKLSLPQFIKASFEVTYENIENEVAEETKKIKSNGYKATLAGGDCATLAGGYKATLAGSDCATLAGGEKSLIVGDSGSVAKGRKGTVILLVERNECGDIISYKAEQIDGATLREDTFCRLKNGEFIEEDSE